MTTEQQFAIDEVLAFGQNETLKADPQAYLALMTRSIELLAKAFPKTEKKS